MKLILCLSCGDGFKLSFDMRECSCGKARGRYLNNRDAEVTADCISIALGNGSLLDAIDRARDLARESANTADREEYIAKARIEYAWIRPNSGPGNPHTRIIPEASE